MAQLQFDASTVTPKGKRGRKPKSEDGTASEQRTVSMDLVTKEIMTRFGRGNTSEGIRRAAKMISKFNLFDREDC